MHRKEKFIIELDKRSRVLREITDSDERLPNKKCKACANSRQRTI